MSFRFLWNFSAKGFPARARTPAWNTNWISRIRRQECGIVAHSRREWGSQRLLKRIKNALDRHGKKLVVFSATGVYNATKDNTNPFNWTDCNINDETLHKISDEMSELEVLRMATIVCSVCKKRLLIDKPIKGKNYCSCGDNKAVVDPATGWQPFLENDDIIIWRKEQTPGEGLYAYKIYGHYSEVRANDFLAMHIDTDYWRSWDSSALSVQTLESLNNPQGGQCVIHWEMLWPKFFANRDYVYVRRYAHMNLCSSNSIMTKIANLKNEISDDYQNLIVVASRACDHPDAPETPTAYRVKKYWSNLVIKPLVDVDEPGIEFSLTYFDDPGANIPSALQSWVAGQGMPDYLARMRKAASVYREAVGNQKDPMKIPDNTCYEIPTYETSGDPSTEVVLTNQMKEIDASDNVVLLSEKYEADDDTKMFLNLIKSDTISALDANNSDENVVKVIKEDSVSEENSNITRNDIENNTEASNMRKQSDNKIEFNGNENKHEKEKHEHENSTAESQEKSTNQNQANHYNYWRLWPLYYFA